MLRSCTMHYVHLPPASSTAFRNVTSFNYVPGHDRLEPGIFRIISALMPRLVRLGLTVRPWYLTASLGDPKNVQHWWQGAGRLKDLKYLYLDFSCLTFIKDLPPLRSVPHLAFQGPIVSLCAAIPSIRIDPVAITTSPPFTFLSIPPHVPTRMNVSAPHCTNSSIAIAADAPPIPVDVTLTISPSK